MEQARDYRLCCTACGARYQDDGVRLECDRAHGPALLRTVYAERRLTVGPQSSMARFGAWLPQGRMLTSAARTAVYHSTALGGHLGLRHLWIAFNGWWPERGATMRTATFKELEASAVLARLAPLEDRTLVVASAGNTAAAFAALAGAGEARVAIVIPEHAWQPLASLVRIAPNAHVIVVRDATYDDAIALARRLAAREHCIAEGGVRNVARRDGMGTVLLSGVEAIGTLPDVYVQAVGSAAGALAAHEAAMRLVDDGRFGARTPRLLLGQNAPFAPIHDAWSNGAAALDECATHDARVRQRMLAAPVLGNAAPPYAAAGGVRDALVATGGRTFAIDNETTARAAALFEELEGIDVEPAAAVAIASLAEAVRTRQVDPDETVLLNVTGGGRKRRPVVTERQRPASVVDRTALDVHAEVALSG